MRRMLVSLLLVTTITIPGCVSVSHRHSHGHGPPPHAPAHGYRAQHGGAELTFDSSRGVYVVAGHASVFYADGRFLRSRIGLWESSTGPDGPWHAVASSSLPPGLAGKQGPHPGKAHHPAGKKNGPAKRHW